MPRDPQFVRHYSPSWSSQRDEVLGCQSCDLRFKCAAPVPGEFHKDAHILFVGEAPGYNEDKQGIPFVGKTGLELVHTYLKAARIERHQVNFTNIIKCRPPDNVSPTEEQVRECIGHLDNEVEMLKPKIIVALGSLAASTLFGNMPLDTHHGFLYLGNARYEIPSMMTWHPALAFHSTRYMEYIYNDFKRLGAVLNGKALSSTMEVPEDKFIMGDATYTSIMDRSDRSLFDDFLADLASSKTVAIDTEVTHKGPWCFSASVRPGEAWVVSHRFLKATGLASDINAILRGRTIVMHNALYDIDKLHRMGLDTTKSKVIDTMIAAYVLQLETKGLKSLSYRLEGMCMEDYGDLVKPHTQRIAVDWAERVVNSGIEFTPPKKVLEWKADGSPHLKQPQSIHRKLKRILNSLESGKDVDVATLLNTYTKKEKWEAELLFGEIRPGDMSDLPEDEAVGYSARDADATIRIWGNLKKQMIEMGLMEPFELDCSIIPIVQDMQDYGFKVSKARLRELDAEFLLQMDVIESDIEEIAGRYVNPGSWKQVQWLLFHHLKLNPPVKKLSKKTGEISTDDEMLSFMVGMHPVVNMIQEWRKFSKLVSTYTGPLIEKADKNSRVHSDIKMTRTDTGRLASADPNLQNIPKRSEEGRKIRSAFICEPDCYLVSGDYSQIELRMVAHVSEDPEMVRIFMEDRDPHTEAAAKLFGIPVDKVDKLQHRLPTKTFNFGLLYGAGPARLSAELKGMGVNWSEQDCENFQVEWFKLFGGIYNCIKAVHAEARRFGYVRTILGRIRRIPEVKSYFQPIREAGERYAFSMKIQGSAQEVIKLGMRNLTPFYRELNSRARCEPKIQIHDDIVFEVHESIVDEYMEGYQHIMQNCYPEFRVPLLVDMSHGKNWEDI